MRGASQASSASESVHRIANRNADHIVAGCKENANVCAAKKVRAGEIRVKRAVLSAIRVYLAVLAFRVL